MHSTNEFRTPSLSERRLRVVFLGPSTWSTRSRNNQACLPSLRSFTHNRRARHRKGPTYARRGDTKRSPIPNNPYRVRCTTMLDISYTTKTTLIWYIVRSPFLAVYERCNHFDNGKSRRRIKNETNVEQ